MRKLNFGCGSRYAAGWDNIDFHSANSQVKRVNLLQGFPYPEGHFDVVYSSHVIEHFTRSQAETLLREAYRVLRPGGIARLVVPDLEATCREYLRILELPDGQSEKPWKHEWIVIELLDQLVRTKPCGEVGEFIRKSRSANPEVMAYVNTRCESGMTSTSIRRGLLDKVRRVTPQKVATKMNYWYLHAISRLLPKGLRTMVFIETGIGERHRWMYDTFGLKTLMQQVGFSRVEPMTYNTSNIPDFNNDQLDIIETGTSYKRNSIYMEAVR